ncbi:MAG: hemerythrin domain-containing protein [Rubrivivax sp.]
MATAKKASAKKVAKKTTAMPVKKSSAKVAPRKTPPMAAKKSATKPAKKAVNKTSARNDATVLLQRDHAEVKKLFKKYEKLMKAAAGDDQRKAVADQVCRLLTVHAQIEEEIFYPAARAAGVESDLMDEADVEHAVAKDLMGYIESMKPGEPYYDAKVKVLGEYIDHHVEEEEDEMFKKCRRAKMDMAGLATQLAERKQALMRQMEGREPDQMVGRVHS